MRRLGGERPKLGPRTRLRVKIQTVLTEESWARYGEFRALLAPFDFEFGFSLMHDGAGRIAIRGDRFATLLAQHELFPGMTFFRRHAEEMLRGDFSRPWKCLGGYKYLYVNAGGRTQFCNQVAGAAHAVEHLAVADLRAANAHKSCEAGCALGCVRTVSHGVGSPLASLRTAIPMLVDFVRVRAAEPGAPLSSGRE